jgi:uncharacterized membrane protein
MHMLVEHISLVIGVIGLTVILWGVLLGVLRLLRLEWASLSGRNILVEREDLRHHLGYYLLLGLEFLIAADIIHTVLTPTLADLAILGAIVAIRTVISFSINCELRQASRHKAGEGKSTKRRRLRGISWRDVALSQGSRQRAACSSPACTACGSKFAEKQST